MSDTAIFETPPPRHAVRLALPAALDLREARPLARALLAERGRDVELDGAAVQCLGAQCLQVLLAARASWAADGHRWRVVDPSPALAAAAGALGAEELLAPPAGTVAP